MRVRIDSTFFHCMIQSIKMNLEWSQNSTYGGRRCIYLHNFISVFFSPKKIMITNVILMFYNSSVSKKLINRHMFRLHIACFCSISTTKIIPNKATALFWVSEQHDGDSFLNESIFKWFGSIAVTHLLTFTCCYLLVVLISHLRYL